MTCLVAGGRLSGKSTELIRVAASHFAYIACADLPEEKP